MEGHTQLSEARERYLDALVAGQAALAHSVIDHALSGGAGAAAICLDVLAPSQARIGERWRSGLLNVAQEHLATTITLGVLDALSRRRTPGPGNGLRVVVTPPEGDPHSIGARFVAEFFAMDGWDVDFLGVGTPGEDLARFARDRAADLVALSATLPGSLPRVTRASNEIRALGDSAPRIILGGQALAGQSVTAASLGCDAIAHAAPEAVSEGRRLVGLGSVKPSLEQQLGALGSTISAMRSRRRMTQRELAEACGLDRTYISLVENGRQNLSFGALSRIADALGASVADMVGGGTGRGRATQ